MPPSKLIRLPTARSLSGDDCRLLVESVVDYAIFMLDAVGNIATWNPGAERIAGYVADEVIGKPFSTFYLDADIADLKPQQALELVARRDRVDEEGWRVRKDGTKFWANVVVTTLREPTGQLRGFGIVIRDLSARRAADEQLHRAEERWHLLVDAVVDYAIFLLDPGGHVSTWNVGARRLKGFGEEEIIGRHFSAFYTKEDRAAQRPQRILEMVRRDGRYEDEGWRVRKDGTHFWANVVITALRDGDGQVIGFAKVTRDLSARRKAEEALRRSEERFRLLVENVAEYAIYMLDPQGRVTTWNLGASRMKGYAASEILGQSFECFFPAQDVAAGKPARELALASEAGRFEDEGWRVRKDGSCFWANAVLTALRDTQGELIGFAKITRDLTARRQSEEAERRLLVERTAREVAEKSEAELRSSREQYRALSKRLEIVLEGVADGITVAERSGRLLFANTAAARIWGFASGSELIEAPAEEIAARFETQDEQGKPFDVESLPSRRLFAGARTASTVLHLRDRHSQRDSWWFVRAGAVLNADDEPELAISIWHDITVRRRQELHAWYLAEATAALGSSLAPDEMLGTLARLLVPELGEWCSVYLLEGEQLRETATAHSDQSRLALAQAYQRRYPPTPEHAGGVWTVVRSGAPAVFNDITEQTLRESTTDPEALQMLRAIGMGAALIVPLRVQHRVIGALALVRAQQSRGYDESDVTLVEELGRRAGVAVDNARLYRATQEAATRAEEASRAKDEFLAIVSHELRTPLTAILGWSTLLRDRVKEPSLAKPIEAVHRNAEAQVKIIDDILDVSRVITGKFRIDPKPMDLVAVTRDALDVIRPSAEAKRIKLELAPCDHCLLIADPERIQQVIWNLLSNAVKFTDAGGSVRVTIAQDVAEAQLTVEDNGRGIDASFLPLVFDRFKQAEASTTRRVGGLGLGLALVRHIVELHGGRASAASPGLGKGSSFSIALPIRAVLPAQPQPAQPALAEVSATSAPIGTLLGGLRVLVVDDEPDACELMALVLGGRGAHVETARSVSEALDAFRRFRPDVVVSDIGMPDEDGYSLIRQIRALGSGAGGGVPALALTAFTREDDRSRALAAGFTAHLRKPIEPDVLASAVAKLGAGIRRG